MADRLIVVKVTSRGTKFMSDTKEWRKSIAVVNVLGHKDAVETAKRLLKPFGDGDPYLKGEEFHEMRRKVLAEDAWSLEFYEATDITEDIHPG